VSALLACEEGPRGAILRDGQAACATRDPIAVFQGALVSQQSRAELERKLDAMDDYQLANVAATLVFIALGPRALYVLRASLALHNKP